MGTWSHETANGVRLGAVMNGFDVRAISRELGRLKLGKGGTTSKGRLYTSVNSDWMYDVSGIPDFNQKYILTAVSHGEYVFLVCFCLFCRAQARRGTSWHFIEMMSRVRYGFRAWCGTIQCSTVRHCLFV